MCGWLAIDVGTKGGVCHLQTRASRHAHAERQGAVEVERALVPTWDPWAPLDPHDDGGRKPKPFRKGVFRHCVLDYGRGAVPRH
jgi:hypothetical protein